jgi:hypothetical protein
MGMPLMILAGWINRDQQDVTYSLKWSMVLRNSLSSQQARPFTIVSLIARRD